MRAACNVLISSCGSMRPQLVLPGSAGSKTTPTTTNGTVKPNVARHKFSNFLPLAWLATVRFARFRPFESDEVSCKQTKLAVRWADLVWLDSANLPNTSM